MHLSTSKCPFLVLAMYGIAVTTAATIVQPFGPVEGVADCGSQGEIVEVRVFDCSSVPCEFQMGSLYRVEVDYIPASSHSRYTIKIGYVRNGSDVPYFTQDFIEEIQAGQEQTLTYPLITSESLAEGDIDLRTEIIADGVSEVCVTVGAKLVTAPEVTTFLPALKHI